jgi:hypothetical protein
MSTVLIWILVGISSGSSNGGTVTVIDRFASAADCGAVITEFRSQKNPNARDYTEWRCLPAKVVRP